MQPLEIKTGKPHKDLPVVRVTGFEPAVSWSQTRRDTKLRYTQINFQLWSNMWSGKFYHNYGELSRGIKGGTSRKSGAVCDLFGRAPDLGFQLPNQARYHSSCTQTALILYMIWAGKSRGKIPDVGATSGTVKLGPAGWSG